MMEKVYVCIPSYNSYEKFERCILSALRQVGCNFEIIVSDDSTIKDVARRIEAFCKKSGVSYFHNNNSVGAASNWNSLLDHAGGSLIKFLHHDDFFVSEHSLAILANSIEKSENCSILFCSSKLVVDGEAVSSTRVSKPLCNMINKSPSLLFSSNSLGGPSACIFRYNKNLRFRDDFQWLVDLEFYYRALQFGIVDCVEEELVAVDVSSAGRLTSVVQSNFKINMKEHWEFLKAFRFRDWHFRLVYRFLRLVLRFGKSYARANKKL